MVDGFVLVVVALAMFLAGLFLGKYMEAKKSKSRLHGQGPSPERRALAEAWQSGFDAARLDAARRQAAGPSVAKVAEPVVTEPVVTEQAFTAPMPMGGDSPTLGASRTLAAGCPPAPTHLRPLPCTEWRRARAGRPAGARAAQHQHHLVCCSAADGRSGLAVHRAGTACRIQGRGPGHRHRRLLRGGPGDARAQRAAAAGCRGLHRNRPRADPDDRVGALPPVVPHARVSWLATSMAGTAAFIYAAGKLQSRIIAGLATTFLVSTAYSGGAVLNRGLVYYFLFSMLLAAALMLLGVKRNALDCQHLPPVLHRGPPLPCSGHRGGRDALLRRPRGPGLRMDLCRRRALLCGAHRRPPGLRTVLAPGRGPRRRHAQCRHVPAHGGFGLTTVFRMTAAMLLIQFVLLAHVARCMPRKLRRTGDLVGRRPGCWSGSAALCTISGPKPCWPIQGGRRRPGAGPELGAGVAVVAGVVRGRQIRWVFPLGSAARGGAVCRRTRKRQPGPAGNRDGRGGAGHLVAGTRGHRHAGAVAALGGADHLGRRNRGDVFLRGGGMGAAGPVRGQPAGGHRDGQRRRPWPTPSGSPGLPASCWPRCFRWAFPRSCLRTDRRGVSPGSLRHHGRARRRRGEAFIFAGRSAVCGGGHRVAVRAAGPGQLGIVHGSGSGRRQGGAPCCGWATVGHDPVVAVAAVVLAAATAVLGRRRASLAPTVPQTPAARGFRIPPAAAHGAKTP